MNIKIGKRYLKFIFDKSNTEYIPLHRAYLRDKIIHLNTIDINMCNVLATIIKVVRIGKSIVFC